MEKELLDFVAERCQILATTPAAKKETLKPRRRSELA